MSHLLRLARVEQLRYGSGAFDSIADEISSWGASNPLLVCSASWLRTQQQRADALSMPIYSGVEQHVPYNRVIDLAETLSQGRHDAVVAIGGGSVIDAARLAGLVSAAGIETEEDLHSHRFRIDAGGPHFAPNVGLPVLAVPTTLSAAELSPGVAASWGDPPTKQLFISPALSCRTVIADPDVSVATPVSVWVTSGFRALDHAIESVMSSAHQPMVDVPALAAIQRLNLELPAALAAPDDADVRLAGHVSAWLSYAGVASDTLGLSHAIGHQLGPRFGLAHGATSAITLPRVVEFYRDNANVRWQSIGDALGVNGPSAIAEYLRGFADRLGLPATLPWSFHDDADVQAVSAAILADPVIVGSPRPLPDQKSFERLIHDLEP